MSWKKNLATSAVHAATDLVVAANCHGIYRLSAQRAKDDIVLSVTATAKE